LIGGRVVLVDGWGRGPAPLDNLIRLPDARITRGRAGAGGGDFRQGRMAVAPIELDSRGAKTLRERVPEAIYESGRSTVRVRLPDVASERFRAVVRAAEAILEVATEPAPE
jgi:transcription-repair coupling factor (superfamily II helicase)